MRKLILEFLGQTFLFSSIVFALHLFLLEKFELPLYDNQIVLAYLMNFLLAVVIFVGLCLLKRKYNDQIGFLFMVGSFLKFAMFFAFFYPAYKADGDLSRLEFFAFFTPYLVCLVSETFSLNKLLND